MIEIAISLAVIAFAVVAIIGVLPAGLNVQRENREDTLVNQDGPYFLEAIRSGAQGFDNLTSFVDQVVIVFTNTSVASITNAPPFSGSNIVGWLSIPRGAKFNGDPVQKVQAYIHSPSGAAGEQGKGARDLAFNYLLTVEIVPFANFAVNTTNYLAYPTNTVEYAMAEARYLQSAQLTNNLYDVRLTFRWPVLPNGELGNGRQVYRAQLSGQQIQSKTPSGTILPFYYFAPQNYVRSQ